MSDECRIEMKPDGPYLAKNVPAIRSARGEALEAKPLMALCRCGGSATKPFCDGTHRRNGFSGARISDAVTRPRDRYPGKSITIHDNRALCAHAGRCTDALAAVFRYGSEPWIDPDGAAVPAIIEAIGKCPSGALSYSLGDQGPEPVARPPSITVTRDGPYAVEGIELAAEAWGKGADRTRYTLCRCGASKNKPFCDGSHWDAKFKDPAD